MKRLRNFFRRHKDSDTSEQALSLQHSQSLPPEWDASSPFGAIRLRPVNEPIVSFRAPLSADEQRVLKDIPREVLEGVEGGEELWRKVVDVLSSPAHVNSDHDSVCRLLLRERTLYLCYFATLVSQHPVPFRPPAAVLKCLLTTLMDRLNIAKFTSSLGTVDPFQASTYLSDVGELEACVPKFARLIRYFVQEDSSGMLLYKKAVEMVVEFLNVLSDKVKKIEPHAEDLDRTQPFLHLLATFAELVCLLTELLKRHTKTHKNCESQLQPNFNSLYSCINAMHTSSATERIAWASWEFLSDALTPSEGGDRNLLLVLLTCLQTISADNESFQMHVAKFIRKRVLTSLVMKLRAGRSLPQRQGQLYVQILIITLKIFRSDAAANRGSIVLLMEEDRKALEAMLECVCCYYYTWGCSAFQLTFKKDSSFLGQVFRELADLAKETPKAKLEAQVFALFSSLTDLDLYELSKGKLPVVQSYTIELLLDFMHQGAKDCAQAGELLFPLILSPLFVAALEDAESEYEIIDADAEELVVGFKSSYFSLLTIVRKSKRADESLAFAFITSLQQYKECATFIRRLNSILLELLNPYDSGFEEALKSCHAAESIFQLLHDCQVYKSCEDCVSECGRMLLTLASLPSLAQHILDSCPAMSGKIIDDYLHMPHLAEFSIQFALVLAAQPGSQHLGAKFTQSFANTKDQALVEKLTAGLERALSDRGSACLKETMAEAHLLEAVLGRLQELESPDTALSLLTIIKLVLSDCQVAQNKMRHNGFTQLQDIVFKLYFEVGIMQKRFDVTYLDNFEGLMEILFEIMLGNSDERDIVVPECLPVILDLLHRLYNAEMKKVFLQRLLGIISSSVKNRYNASVQGVTNQLLSILPTKPNSELKELIVCVLTAICSLRFTPENLQMALKCIDDDSRDGRMSETTVKVLSFLKRCFQDSIHTHQGEEGGKRIERCEVKPRNFFIFSSEKGKIEANVSHFLENFRAVAVWMWLKPTKAQHCMAVFSFSSDIPGKELSVKLDEAGSLLVSLSHDAQLQSFQAPNSAVSCEKWSYLSFLCVPVKGQKRKFDISLYLNSRELLHTQTEAVSRQSFTVFRLGSASDCRSFQGLISTMYCANAVLDSNDVAKIMQLGSNYEGLFLMSESRWSEFWSVETSRYQATIHPALVVVLNPKLMRDSESVEDMASFLEGNCEDRSVEKRRVPPPTTREAAVSDVQPCVTIRLPDALRALGGPAQLFPLLRRKGPEEWYLAAVDEFLQICMCYCKVHSLNVVDDITKSFFCDMLTFMLEEASKEFEFTENIVGSVIFILQSLSWSSSAQSKAFEKLLLNFKIWRHQDWTLKKPILITITQYLKEHPRHKEVKFMVETVLMLMERNFSMVRSKSAKEARREIMDLLENSMVGPQDYGAEAIEPVLGWAIYAAHQHPGNALVYLSFFLRLIERGKLPTDAKLRHTFKQTMWVLLRKTENCREATVLALEVLHRFLSDRSQNPKEDLGESQQQLVDDPEFCKTLDLALPSSLTLEVYKAVLPFCVRAPHSRGRGSFQELSRVQGSVAMYMPAVLDVICSKLAHNEDLQAIIGDVKVLVRAMPSIVAEKTKWTRWLPHLLQTADLSLDSVDVAAEVLSAAVSGLEGVGGSLRAVLNLPRDISVLAAAIEKLAKREVPHQSKLLILNLHELAYLLEDVAEKIAEDPLFPEILSNFSEVGRRVSILYSTYPPLPRLSHEELLQLYDAYPNVVLTAQGPSKKREGGILRIAMKLHLISLRHSDLTQPSLQVLLTKLNDVAIDSNSQKVKSKLGASDVSLCKYINPEMPVREDSVFTARFLALWIFSELALCGERFSALLAQLEEIIGGKSEVLERAGTVSGKWAKLLLHFYKEFPKAFESVFSKEPPSAATPEEFLSQLSAALSAYTNSTLPPAPLPWLLLTETWLRISIIQHSLSFYSKTEQARASAELPEPSFQSWDSIQGQENSQFVSYNEKLVLMQDAEELDKLLARRKVTHLLKRATSPAGLWAAPLPETVFWKVDKRVDGEMRRSHLLMNLQGHTHQEAINKKYRPKLQDDPSPPAAEPIDDGDIESERVRVLRTISSFAYRGNEVLDMLEAPEQVREEDEVEYDETNLSMSDDGLSEHRRSYPSDYDIMDLNNPDLMLNLECERISLKGAVFGNLQINNKFLVFRSSGKAKPPELYPGSALQWMCVAMPCEKIWELSEIHEVLGRRFMQRHTALEFFTYSGGSIYFNLFSEENRKKVLTFLQDKNITGLKLYELPHKEFHKLHYTSLWRKGEISNFEYLMLLNKFASRSFNDISQYPVFPWVLSDYSSAVLNLGAEESYRDLGCPLGALDPKCRSDAIKKYEEWLPDTGIDAFHYGSHYSTGGIVMYYLIRLEPFSTLAIQLQDKHFDVADRLFWSVESAWNGSVKNSGDYKELIPEFFTMPEFLLNLNQYIFGCRQNCAAPVGNVELPPWAGGNVYNFVRLQREALESSFVSENLGKWIDLIFGCKQYGEEAAKAVNVFFYITYERNVKRLFDNGAMRDPNFSGILDQISHYGQTPCQLLTGAHPKRNAIARPQRATEKFFTEGYRIETPQLHEVDGGPYVCMLCCKSKLLLIKSRSAVHTFRWRNSAMDVFGRPEVFAKEEVTLAQVSSSFMSEKLRNTHFGLMYPLLFSGLHYDYSFKIHNVETGDLLRSIYHHDDLVTCIGLSCKAVSEKSDSAQVGLIATGSADLTIALWEIRSNDPFIVKNSSPSKVLRGHKREVIQCCIDDVRKVVAAADAGGRVLLHHYSSDRTTLIREGGAVECIALSKHGMIAVYWTGFKSLISIYSLNASELWTLSAPYQLNHMEFNVASDHLVLSGRNGTRVLNLFAQPQKMLKCIDKMEATMSMFTPDERSLLVLAEGSSLLRIDCVSRQAKKEIAERMRIVGFPCD